MNNEYLAHHGVKGMKWGVRRYQNADGSLNAKGIKRYAKKGYTQDAYNTNKSKVGKAYDRVTGSHKYAGSMTYDTSTRAQNKARAEQYIADRNRARTDNIAQNKARAEKFAADREVARAAKKERKAQIKDTYKEINENAKLSEKIIFNNATRKRAAKYVVDNNMSIADAKKKANKDAIRNTTRTLAVIGGVTVSTVGALAAHGNYISKKINKTLEI